MDTQMARVQCENFRAMDNQWVKWGNKNPQFRIWQGAFEWRIMIPSKCFTDCVKQTRLLNNEQSLKFKDHHFNMKQSTAPLYRGWYGCDLVKFGEMLTGKRTCAVAIGVFKTPFKRNLLIKMNQHTRVVTEMQSEWCWQIGRGLNYQDTRRQCLLCLHPTNMPLFITLY